MPLPTEPVYSTHAEFIANTPIISQDSILENDWKPFALRAEAMIDSLVNCVIPCNKDQQRKFPTYNENGVCEIPNDVILAAIEITSFLIINSSKSDDEILDPLSSEAKREVWSATSYSKEKSSSSDSGQSSTKTNLGLPPLAIRLLKPWCIDTAAASY